MDSSGAQLSAAQNGAPVVWPALKPGPAQVLNWAALRGGQPAGGGRLGAAELDGAAGATRLGVSGAAPAEKIGVFHSSSIGVFQSRSIKLDPTSPNASYRTAPARRAARSTAALALSALPRRPPGAQVRAWATGGRGGWSWRRSRSCSGSAPRSASAALPRGGCHTLRTE